MVVDDDNVGFLGLSPHLGDEATMIVGASRPQASLGARVQLVPQRARLRQSINFRTVAGLGCLLPAGNLGILIDLFKAVQNRLVAQRSQLVAAQVVGPALHIANGQRAEQRLEKRNVTKEKLVLQRLCARRYDDPVSGPQRRQQIGKGFAGSGSCLDDQVAPLVEGLLNGLGHLELARTVLIGQGRTREDAARSEKLVQGRECAGWSVGGRHCCSTHHSDAGSIVAGDR